MSKVLMPDISQLTLVGSMEIWASFPTKQEKNQIYNFVSKELIP